MKIIDKLRERPHVAILSLAGLVSAVFWTLALGWTFLIYALALVVPIGVSMVLGKMTQNVERNWVRKLIVVTCLLALTIPSFVMYGGVPSEDVMEKGYPAQFVLFLALGAVLSAVGQLSPSPRTE